MRGVNGPVLYLTSVTKAINDDPPAGRPVGLEALGQPAYEADERTAAWMSPAFIDAIARRVLELDANGALGQARERALLTVAEVAARLSVSQAWVYAHKRDLGAIRLGSGPKARLRFDATAVLTELNRRDSPARSAASEPKETPKGTRRRLVSRPLPRASHGA